MSARVSVCMIAQDDGRRIGLALDSVQWADEIVVVDGGSEDETVSMAEARGARVVVSPWPGFQEQIQRSVDETTGDWVFRLDSDEVVTPELAEQIRRVVEEPDPADGYRVRRKNYFLGKWIRRGGWWPDPQLRLVRRSKVVVRGAPGHESVDTDGRRVDLTGALEHDTNPSLGAALDRVARYSRLLAPDRAKRKRIRAVHIFTHTFAAFFRKYLVQRAFLDGAHGFLIASLHAMTKFSVYARAWEIQRKARSS